MKNLNKITCILLQLLVFFTLMSYAPSLANAYPIYNSQASLDELNETSTDWGLRVTFNSSYVTPLNARFDIFATIIDPETGQPIDLGLIRYKWVNSIPQIWDPGTGTWKTDWSGIEFVLDAYIPKTYQNTTVQLTLRVWSDACFCYSGDPDITYCYLPSIRDNSCAVNYGNPTNVTTSNKTLQKADLSVDTPSGKLEFYRTYNSLLGSMGDNSYLAGPLGYNWTHNYNYGLTIKGTAPNRRVAFRKEDGKTVFFDESGGVFNQTTTGEQFQLTDNGNGTFSLLRDEGSRIQFNNTIDDNTNFIRPEWMEDSKGRRLTFTYAHYQWATNVWIEL